MSQFYKIGFRTLFSIAFSIVIGSLTLSSLHAANYGFMPGDAFFHCNFSEDDFEKLSDNGIELSYGGVPNTGALCGSAGFNRIKIVGDTKMMNRQLRTLHKELREFYPKHVQIRNDGSTMILNGFHLFVYNADITGKDGFSDQRIALRYNENWNSIPETAFQSKTRKLIRGFNGKEIPAPRIGRYTSFIKDSDAIIHDWKYCRKFPALNVTVPEGVGWGIPGKPITTSVSVDVGKIQLIIIPDEDLRPYFERRKRKEFFSISKNGISWKRFAKNKEVESIPWSTVAKWNDFSNE